MANNYNYQLRIYQASNDNQYKEVIPNKGIYNVKNGNHIKIEVKSKGYWIRLDINPKNYTTDYSSGFKGNEVSFDEFKSVKEQIVISDTNIKKWRDKTDKHIGLIEINMIIFPYISRYGIPFNSDKRIIDPKTREVDPDFEDYCFWHTQYRLIDYFEYGVAHFRGYEKLEKKGIMPDLSKPMFDIYDRENTKMEINTVLKFRATKKLKLNCIN